MKKRWFSFWAAVCLILSLGGCAANHPVTEQILWHMDTAITIRLYGDQAAAQSVMTSADHLLRALDAELSATDEDSPVSAFNRASDGGEVAFSEDALALIALALKISQATGGAFDITTAPLTSLWQTCEKEGRLPTDAELAVTLPLVDFTQLRMDGGALSKAFPDLRMDLGGIGKGHATDRLYALLQDADGITGGIVSFGSNIAVIGQKPDGTPWKIALRDPNDASSSLGYLHLTEGQMLSVSGDYERFFTIDSHQYGHILDPRTGYQPQNGLRSVAVLAESGALSDALSTAFMVMGEDAARALQTSGTFAFEAIFVYDSPSGARVSMTDGIRLER